jgi:hypothetical protein
MALWNTLERQTSVHRFRTFMVMGQDPRALPMLTQTAETVLLLELFKPSDRKVPTTNLLAADQARHSQPQTVRLV